MGREGFIGKGRFYWEGKVLLGREGFKRVYYPLDYFRVSFIIFLFGFSYERYKIISSFNIYGSFFFNSVFNVVVTKSRSSHNFFRKFFCKNWHLISCSISFLARCMLVQNITLSPQNLFNPSSFVTNFSLDNLSIRSFLNVSFEKCL